ncbi:hypothetical protein K450DRAFT_271571 [Umbelopsis ramanniana AG]|uniref:GATA-type domain-containing protein n=1 Tax=Umbelopsis ramanniana AG TaxID=1314678 RepID=A0AAD5EBL0_UMBRA|nr:uncharacterized protein K450DRAFT_271571 [Umbelopsis ramanniana AG]KAI8579986.1 hypothetical protein K450DRAFT_271571 [Umbelopsis ramanniana AG]
MKIESLLDGSPPSPTKYSFIAVHDLKDVYQRRFEQEGFHIIRRRESRRQVLTDYWISSCAVPKTSFHLKLVSRHTPSNCFRCSISSGKPGYPIKSVQIRSQMRMLLVFFRKGDKDNTVLPQFLLFPAWLLHLFRYSQHGNTPGRCDIRFIEDVTTAKEDQIFRFNNVINTLFRFDINHIDKRQIEAVIGLSNHLANVNLEHGLRPPTRQFSHSVHYLFADLVDLLGQRRPDKLKPACLNCFKKPSSRRSLCVACYRYQLKHKKPRPERLIVANRSGSKIIPRLHKICNNCRVEKTHQWYRNMVGNGHWCETCKSYYIRHKKLRPRELYIRVANRKVDLRQLIAESKVKVEEW